MGPAEQAEAQVQLPELPPGVPDLYEDHVKLMYDLQWLAYQGDMTRVFPLPAPARISTGPPVASTASRC